VLSNNLKKIRMQEFMLNKKEFSALLTINESQYSRYESGQSQPTLEIAIKVATTLKRQITDIWNVNDVSE